MAYGLDEQTQFMPYQPDELMALEGLLPPQQGLANAPPMAMPSTTPTAAPEPAAAPTAPAPVATPPAQAAPATAVIPPAPPPLSLGRPAQAARPPLPLAGVSVSGMPEAQRKQVLGAYQELASQQTANAEQAGKTEGKILQKRMGAAQKRVKNANVEANKARMALAGKQAARRKLEAEGAEWSKMKESPAQAFEGQEWAGVLASIGIAAGAFSNAMGWQNGNPVLDQFQRTVDRSIAAQREQKDSRLQEIAARIGDSHAAEQLLGAQLHDAIADRAAAEQEKASSQEAFARLGGLVQAERQKSQEMLLGAYERTAQQEQRQYQIPTSGGSGKSPAEELQAWLQVKELLAKQGYTSETNEIAQNVDKMIDQLAPGGKSDRQVAREKEDQEKGKPTEVQLQYSSAADSVDRLAQVSGLKRDPTTGEWEADESMVDLGAGTGEWLGEQFGKPTPVQDALEMAAEAYGRARSGGVISDDEEKRFMRQVGKNTTTRAQLASKLNALEASIEGMLPPSRRRGGSSGAPSQWK